MEKKLVVLTGPTAVGKTKLSIALAKSIDGEIISADSMQVYQKMDIGSAKIMPDEMAGVPHFLIDIISPSEAFNVVVFQQKAKAAMDDIYSRGKTPIIVGGTGFYIQAILNDIEFDENEQSTEIREKYEHLLQEQGEDVLHQELAKVDEQAAAEIHPHNSKRVIRALEYFEQTGQKISEHNQEQRAKQSPYDFRYFVLNDDRGNLYKRIDERVDKMIADGLIDEVKGLHEDGYTKDMVSMQGLGYKEILEYLDGECSLEDAVCRIKRDTRHFAKRQVTWFKRERDVIWVNKDEFDYNDKHILNYMLDEIKI